MSTLPVELVQNLPAIHVEWPECNKDGKALAVSETNTRTLLRTLGTDVCFNAFTQEAEIFSRGAYTRLTDTEADGFWAAAHHYGLAAKHADLVRMLRVAAQRRRYHPVLNYLKSLEWDRRPRIHNWLSTYLGADDTPLVRGIGISALRGMIRRVYEPGCPHDHIVILEGAQGVGKSSALRILGGRWFADGLKLGQSGKETIELMRGVWVGEVAELAGQRRNEVEAIKEFLSRREDRARLVFDKLTSSVPRQFILFGTTNDTAYLKDATGARRFYPVRVGKIDLDGLARDRDALLAEAYADVALFGRDNGIARELWASAAEAQERRREISPIEAGISEKLDPGCHGFIRKSDLRRALGAEDPKSWSQIELNALTTAMHRLGWQGSGKKQRPPGGGDPVPVFQKLVPGCSAPWLEYSGGKFAPGTRHSASAGF